jgi:hypothetical protein
VLFRSPKIGCRPIFRGISANEIDRRSRQAGAAKKIAREFNFL